MQALAYAKLNLSLEVVGRRADGYHRVVTILHTIDLADRLTFKPSESLSLRCDPPIGPTEENLVLRAARQLQESTGCAFGAAITLEKRIPLASGLGGGSADAAATLRALNTFWDLKLPEAKLCVLATRLGSDVPFLMAGGCALAEGRGEVVTSLPPMPIWWAVILVPQHQTADKTARLYSLLGAGDFTDGSATRRLADGLRAGRVSIEKIGSMPNAFQRAAAIAFPALESYQKRMNAAGAHFAHITGSGPAVFTLVETREEGEQILARLQSNGDRGVYLLRLITPRK
ncbi:MAG: 4-(cytidine 5'-diphospho)-2-C-methyl-D-erythritol kinase [Chloroflexi bacterium]|nr:4-(cytidine 5'-diphospho)-2-C-methyl-D-erythritol kinase [Chloroflexota bacterium]